MQPAGENAGAGTCPMEVVELLVCYPEKRLEGVVFHCEEEDDGCLGVCLEVLVLGSIKRDKRGMRGNGRWWGKGVYRMLVLYCVVSICCLLGGGRRDQGTTGPRARVLGYRIPRTHHASAFIR